MILDKTIFHPQGGGQPADDGTISMDGLVFTVKALQAKDDAILHIGTFDKVNLRNKAKNECRKGLFSPKIQRSPSR